MEASQKSEWNIMVSWTRMGREDTAVEKEKVTLLYCKMVQIWLHLFLRAKGRHTRVFGKGMPCSKPCFRNNHSCYYKTTEEGINDNYDLWLASEQYNTAKVMGRRDYVTRDCYDCYARDSLLVTMKEEVAMFWAVTGKGHAARKGRWSPHKKETDVLWGAWVAWSIKHRT